MGGTVSQIEKGMGAVGQSMGDAFYPDNPKRRQRVDQLQDDIKVMQAEFAELKKDVDQQLGELQSRLDKLLRDSGYDNADDMDRKMQTSLNPDTLAEWNAFKVTLNKSIAAEKLVFTITGFITIATGVVAAGLAIAGVITFATAGSALMVAGAIALVAAGVIAILAAVEAKKEREELQKAIVKLVNARVEAKQALEQMRTHLNYVADFGMFLDSSILSQDAKTFNDFTGNKFKIAFQRITRDKILLTLNELDVHRQGGSWRNEDPSFNDVYKSGPDPVLAALIKMDAAAAQRRSRTAAAAAVANAPRISDPLKDWKVEMHDRPRISDPFADAEGRGAGRRVLGVPVAMMEAKALPVAAPPVKKEDSIEGQGDAPVVEMKKGQRSWRLRLLDFQSYLDADAEELDSKRKWHIHAEVSETKPGAEINITDVAFSLTDTLSKKVYSHCKVSLLTYKAAV